MNREEIKVWINGVLEQGDRRIMLSLIGRANKYSKAREYIINETEYLPKESKIGERIYQILNDLYKKPICPICKINYLKYIGGRYTKNCSTKCSNNNIDVINKKKKTCLENNGCEYPSQNKEIQEKQKQTMVDRYGCEYPSQNKEIQEKTKHTCLEIYGYEHPLQNKEVQEKQKQTCLENNGCEYPLQNKEIQEKHEQTCLEIYGFKYPLQNKEVQEKQKQTCLENNGCEYPSQNKEIRKKQKQLILDKNNKKYKIYLDKINLKSMSDNILSTEKNIFTCLKCGKSFKSCFFNIQQGKRCPYCSTNHKQSKDEIELYDFLKSILKEEIIHNETEMIKNPKTNRLSELDIYIPEKKIAIEYNGLYWHSEFNKDNNYHLLKTNLCKEKGIRLIHIFEDEWVHKKDVVKSRLKHILKDESEKIDLVCCEIKEINNRTSNKFLDKYDIEGESNSDINLGAFYNNELISVMTFLKENNIYKLNRFCYNYNFYVVDIADKLLNYFKENYEWEEIYSNVDLRWSNGNLYDKLGFELYEQTKPNYWYFKNLQRINRFDLRKRPNEPKDKTEEELRNEEGYLKIYDCGYLKYKMINKEK